MPTGLARARLAGTVRYRSRRPVALGDDHHARGRRLAEEVALPGRPALDLPVPARGARPLLEARAPDPGDGLPWGVAAIRGEGGGWCTSGWARIVGERIGGVDHALGTFVERPSFANGCQHAGQLTRTRPLSFGYGGGGGFAGEPGADPQQGASPGAPCAASRPSPVRPTPTSSPSPPPPRATSARSSPPRAPTPSCWSTTATSRPAR